MTVATTGTNAFFLGTGSPMTFPFTFAMPYLAPAQAAQDLVVTYFDPSGHANILTEGGTGPGQYLLSLSPPVPPSPTSAGGAVTFTISGAPIPAGSSLNIQRNVPLVQGTSLSNQGTLWPQVIEEALDYLIMCTQQFPAGVRAIVGPPSDPTQINYMLPPVVGRASQWLGFDGYGNVIAGFPPFPSGPQTISSLWTFNAGIVTTTLSASSTVNFTSASSATFNGAVSFPGTTAITFTPAVTFNGNTTFGGASATFNTQVLYNSTVQFTNPITVNTTATLNGATTFGSSGSVTFNNGFTTASLTNTTFNGNVALNGNTTIGGALTFTASTTFSNSVQFSAAVSFQSATIQPQFNDGLFVVAGSSTLLATTISGAASFTGATVSTSSSTATTFNGNITQASTSTAAFNGPVSFASGQTATFNGNATFASSGNFTCNSSSVSFAQAPTFTLGASMSGELVCSAAFAMQTSGGVAIGSSSNPGTGALSVTNGVALLTTVASNASGGNVANGVKLSNATNLGLYFGTGAPTFSAAQGSLYMNVGGSSTSTRLYVATNATGTWTNFTSAA